MARLSGIRLPRFNITAATDASWTLLGPGNATLLPELEELYWEGVRGELENIIWTLKTWQKPEFSDVTVADEEDDFVHGFDTFIDQVAEEPRAFALRYGAIANAPFDDAFDVYVETLISRQERRRTGKKRKTGIVT